MKIKTSELEGVALDWAVAQAVEAWKTAHELFPTWTLDATFSGVRPMVYSDGQVFCQLIPNNPMRQDPQKYSPSADWSQGGPLIESAGIGLQKLSNGWMAATDEMDFATYEATHGPTPLIAACRAIVADNLGDEVEVPDELL